jgi:hypothetical protein
VFNFIYCSVLSFHLIFQYLHDLSYYTASTPLGNTSHTTMYHDTIIVLEHSFRYIKSIYYSLVTLSKSSYLYIDFAICKWSWIYIACSLQKAYKLAILIKLRPTWINVREYRKVNRKVEINFVSRDFVSKMKNG